MAFTILISYERFVMKLSEHILVFVWIFINYHASFVVSVGDRGGGALKSSAF